MDKIYVVTHGCYSDYMICGVFNDKEKANRFATMFHYDEVEEYPLNPIMDEIRDGLKFYSVRMWRDGTLCGFYNAGQYHDFNKGLPKSEHKFVTEGKILLNKCYAKDKEHAIKITNELRAMLIATNQWDDFPQ